MALRAASDWCTNYAGGREAKCMNCGVPIICGEDLYTRRFCSTHCRERYLAAENER